MTLPDLALIGLARSGKDTVSKYLVEHHGYTRVAFADALKQVAYDTNPYIRDTVNDLGEITHKGGYLADLVDEFGWEYVKDNYPEARRFLQNLGVAARNQNPNHWLDIGMRKAEAAYCAGTPVVFTDVRFRNEHDMLKGEAFRTVKLFRPGIESGTHISETELGNIWTDDVIVNDGTLSALHDKIEAIVTR